MKKTSVEKTKKPIKPSNRKTKRRIRPEWVGESTSSEEQLCPDCFKVVGVESRYNLVCLLGRSKGGVTVGNITKELGLKQPTITHHLNVLKSVDAVTVKEKGRERIYSLNRGAHCFEECKIPF